MRDLQSSIFGGEGEWGDWVALMTGRSGFQKKKGDAVRKGGLGSVAEGMLGFIWSFGFAMGLEVEAT